MTCPVSESSVACKRMPFASAAGRTTSIAACTTAARSVGRTSRRIFPETMRETSSKSSINCVSARALRSIVTRAFAALSGPSTPSRSMRTHAMIGESGVRSSCDTVARNASLARFAASASARVARSRARISSRSRSSARRAVMSRAILAAPTIPPLPSLIGDTDSDTASRRPSLATRSVSKCSMRRPSRSVATIVTSSGCRSGGRSVRIDFPRISSAA